MHFNTVWEELVCLENLILFCVFSILKVVTSLFLTLCYRQDANTREWVRDVWNIWFDQVFLPSPEHSDDEDDEGSQDVDELTDNTSHHITEDRAKNK